MYTKKDFGKQLAEEVKNKYDISYLSFWAHEKYLEHANRIDKETRAAIMKIIAMVEGAEFVLTKKQLLELVANLQRDS